MFRYRRRQPRQADDRARALSRRRRSSSSCMGVNYGLAATPETMIYMRNLLPPGSKWAAFGIGPHAFPMLAQALLLGGHVRVGLEDNYYLEKGVKAPHNAALVEKARARSCARSAPNPRRPLRRGRYWDRQGADGECCRHMERSEMGYLSGIALTSNTGFIRVTRIADVTNPARARRCRGRSSPSPRPSSRARATP